MLLASWQTNNAAGLKKCQFLDSCNVTFLEASKGTSTGNEVYKRTTERICICYRTLTMLIYRSILESPILLG